MINKVLTFLYLMVPNSFHYAFDSDANSDADSDADTDSLHWEFWSLSTGLYS